MTKDWFSHLPVESGKKLQGLGSIGALDSSSACGICVETGACSNFDRLSMTDRSVLASKQIKPAIDHGG